MEAACLGIGEQLLQQDHPLFVDVRATHGPGILAAMAFSPKGMKVRFWSAERAAKLARRFGI